MADTIKQRPVYRNIHISQIVSYRLPPSGIVSILHRVSGMLMFGLLPFILYVLDQSLQSEVSFAMLHLFASGVLVKLVLLAISWAYLHHFCAGIRHLLMDFHVGLDKDAARESAVIVLIISVGLAALIGLKMFGVF